MVSLMDNIYIYSISCMHLCIFAYLPQSCYLWIHFLGNLCLLLLWDGEVCLVCDRY